MAVSIFSFAEYISEEIGRFEKKYIAKHNADPEHYPLDIPDNNSGLWLEFFVDFLDSNEV